MVAWLLVIAFWPMLAWYGQRTLDPTDPAWGLLPLLVLVWFSAKKPEGESVPIKVDYRLPTLGLVLYLSTYHWAPNLVSAVFAVFTVVSLVGQVRFGQRFHLAAFSLGCLALPLLSSLQFYVGYPLRVLVAKGAALLLQWNGLRVKTDGAGLNWAGELVLVDAPCSGINMLWVALFAACCLCLMERFSGRQTLGFLTFTAGATILANVMRASTLFYLEAEIVMAPAWAHTGVGVVSLGLLVLGLVLLAKSMEGRGQSTLVSTQRAKSSFVAVCLLAALVPLFSADSSPVELSDFPGWPSHFEGRLLEEGELRPEEVRFYRTSFPGKVGRFSDGQREIILRWITQPTRALHPAADCFRGLGYQLGKPTITDSFRAFTVEKDHLKLSVREQIKDTKGHVWTDVSAWYWDAVLGRSEGPYWVVVVAERAD